MQNRFAAIRRLDGAFDDIAEDADLYDALNDVVRALPAELFTASTPMSAVRRHLQVARWHGIARARCIQPDGIGRRA